MSAVWQLEKAANAFEVSKLLLTRFGRRHSPKTTGILLARLAQKGYLSQAAASPEGKGRPAYFYSANISRAAALARQFSHFLNEHGIEDPERELLRSLLEPQGGQIR